VGFQEATVRIWHKIVGLVLTPASFERDRRYSLFNRIQRQNNHVRFVYRDYARPPLPLVVVSVVFTAAPIVVVSAAIVCSFVPSTTWNDNR